MRSELEYARAGRGNVLSPSELAVEFFCALHIRDRYDDNLQLHVNWGNLRLASVLFVDYILRSCHPLSSYLYVMQRNFVVGVMLWGWVVPNIGRELILERCIHGLAEQFQSRIRPEGNRALHDKPLLVVHD